MRSPTTSRLLGCTPSQREVCDPWSIPPLHTESSRVDGSGTFAEAGPTPVLDQYVVLGSNTVIDRDRGPARIANATFEPSYPSDSVSNTRSTDCLTSSRYTQSWYKQSRNLQVPCKQKTPAVQEAGVHGADAFVVAVAESVRNRDVANGSHDH